MIDRPVGTTHASLGRALMTMKDLDGAIAAYRDAARLDPQGRVQSQLHGALNIAGRHVEALQLTLASMQRNPARVDDPMSGLRYSAACTAMNCADGKGVDAPPPAERPAYRKQALELLTAELAAIRKRAAAHRVFVHERIGHWLVNQNLASVRDPMAIGRLPPDERDAWTKLWAEVRDLRDATGPSVPPKLDKH